MIQFNLLPDVKLQFITTKRRKRLVVVIATSVMAGSIAIMLLLFVVVNAVQKRHLSALERDITASTEELQNTPDLDKILTIQNQLQSLPSLHDQKPAVSRLFNYLLQITPAKVSISGLSVDLETNSMKIQGSTTTLSSVNKFVDTLKFTTYTAKNGEQVVKDKQRTFSNVVLTEFGRTDKEASYTIDLVYDPLIFDTANKVTLTVPETITTRSETEKPLFKPVEGKPIKDTVE